MTCYFKKYFSSIDLLMQFSVAWFIVKSEGAICNDKTRTPQVGYWLLGWVLYSSSAG